MIYPDTFEQEIGFADIKTQLKGRCISSLGTEWVDTRLTFMTDYHDITESLALATEFIRLMATEEDVIEENFFDVRSALLRIRPARTHLEELELFDLKRSLETILSLTRFLTRRGGDTATVSEEEEDEGASAEGATYPALARMAEGVATHPDIIRRIDAVLNRYGKIKDTASPELLTIRHSIEVTLRNISHTLRSIITEAQSDGYIDRDVAPALRDGRLVIPVAPALKRKIKGIIHDESATGKTVFIEPAAVVEANNRIRELRAAERREVIRILQELTEAIRPHVGDMLSSLRFLGHIDFLRALSLYSTAINATVPRVQPTPAIDWNRAVHPLVEATLARHGNHMIPLDITLRNEEHILLISGPNAGGKSVCLKTVGLLQYMLQCGMPVPLSPDSTMGIFSDILIDIGDQQSIEGELSTYSAHLNAMNRMMKRAGKRSLLLIDEMGSGTEPQIGGALAEGILDRFVALGAYGVITTHYQNLKHYASSSPTIVNGAMLYDRSRMAPLYRLRTGNPGSSFAIEIARRMGLPEEVVRYATDKVGNDYVMSEGYLQDIARDKTYWENKRRAIHRREQQLEETVNRYESELSTLQRERRDVMNRARAEAENLLRNSNAQIENTIRAIRQSEAERERTREARRELTEYGSRIAAPANDEADADIARRLAKIKRRQERKRNGTPADKSIEKPTASDGVANIVTALSAEAKAPVKLRAGAYVRIHGQHATGRIESIGGRTARVLFGVIYTTVPLSRLEPAEAPKAENTPATATVTRATRDAMYETKLHFRPEIDLRGMRADEAMTALARFVDEAIELEQSRIRILHGTGTGALRTVVRRYLGTVPGVNNYHDEHVQFGGAGITVADLD